MSRPSAQRGLGVFLILAFGALLVYAIATPTDVPITVPFLATAGILSGLAMCIRSRWADLIEACSAALIGTVLLAAGIIGLIAENGGVVSSIVLATLGGGCGVAAVLRLRALRASARQTSESDRTTTVR